ncbi:MAG: VIT domain-containing protein [Gammaproteobacteria bacterium]|nr:VIT domain-containing protein [Gammaproteobacteria bacterium]MCY4211582.1 VIT domain-containing protein [Gammaproteobacteria bacterium]
MNTRKRLVLAAVLCPMILLVGAALLTSCTRTPPPETSASRPAQQSSKPALPTQEAHDLCPTEATADLSGTRVYSDWEQAQASDEEWAFEGPWTSEVVISARRSPDSPTFLAYQKSTGAAQGAVGFNYVDEDSPESLARGPEAMDAEVWVIAKASPEEQVGAAEEHIAAGDEDTLDPGSGAMVVHLPPDSERGVATEAPLPLQHTAVDAAIAGHISTVRVKQQFANPFDTKIEAVYVFPLPQQAAVSEFLMVIGERTIRGILREQEEAEAIYRAARDQGYQASLLVQQRPNIFEQKVANIEPGKAIDVDITYFNTLAYNDGWYSFVFPTVVGPRFNPPGHPDPVPALPRGGRSASPADSAVEYLAPTERSGHDLGITVSIDAGVPIEDITSTHEISVQRDGPAVATVQLAQQTTIPNRDFVLDFRVAGETVKSNLLTYRDPDTGEGFFSLMMIPPIDRAHLSRRAMELVFVIDTSGSMQGRPLAQAKQAVATALGLLNPNDTFQIIRFSDDASQFGREPVLATGENLAAARRYLANLHGQGGTMMVEGIRAALGFPHDPSRYRFVSFMTDGYIGNEADILAEVHRRIGNARIFSFGVGESVNRYLMERMAKVGRGAVAYLGLNDSAEAVMDAFLTRVSRAALTDLEIDWGDMTVSDTYPHKLPDLFVGRPLVVAGKFRGDPGAVTVCGTVDGARRPFVVEAADAGNAGSSLAKVWARANIADLTDRQATAGDPQGELGDAIKRIALEHQLASDYTSFVAVDSTEITAGEHGVTVHQAVPVPEGVRYETTVVGGER